MDYLKVLLILKKIKVHTKIKNLIVGKGYKKQSVLNVRRILPQMDRLIQNALMVTFMCTVLCTIVSLPFSFPTNHCILAIRSQSLQQLHTDTQYVLECVQRALRFSRYDVFFKSMSIHTTISYHIFFLIETRKRFFLSNSI